MTIFKDVQMQEPLTHVVSVGQTLPQVPQLLLSVCVSTQPLEQHDGALLPHTLPQ
jgi:hypothetical protein